MLLFRDWLREEKYTPKKKDKKTSPDTEIYNGVNTGAAQETMSTVPPTMNEDFDKNPNIGWWQDHQGHHVVYHGTHDRNVPDILKNGITHKDSRTGMISVTHDPHTAHGYAAMSGGGGERNFKRAGSRPVNTPHEQRSVIKMHIPHDWAQKHMDTHLRGNVGEIKDRMKDKSRYEAHRASGRPDHEYYQRSELRFNKEIPPHFIVGVHKKVV